jgi:hypothetical protein
MGSFVAVVAAGNTTVELRTEAMIRKPFEPVSIRIWSIVWQLDVPGAQIVTLTEGRLTPVCFGPASTISEATLEPVGSVGCGVLLVLPAPPPPQPQSAVRYATEAAARLRRAFSAALLR